MFKIFFRHCPKCELVINCRDHERFHVSKLVSSSEVWYDVTKQEYKKLESVDEMFYRRLFNVQISTPKESLYMETGKIPIKYIISGIFSAPSNISPNPSEDISKVLEP